MNWGKIKNLLTDQAGGQMIKSAVGILVFIAFIAFSILLNSPGLPLSYQLAFGQSGSSGSGGGGGGGGQAANAGSVGDLGSTRFLGAPIVTLRSTADSIELTWSAATNAVSYLVYAKKGGADSPNQFTKVVTLAYTDSKYVHKGKTGEIWSFYVAAINPSLFPGQEATQGIFSGQIGKVETIAAVSAPPPTVAVPTAATAATTALIQNIRKQIADLLAKILFLIQERIKSGQPVATSVSQQLAQVSATVNGAKPPALPVPTRTTAPPARGNLAKLPAQWDENDITALQKCLEKLGHFRLPAGVVYGFFGPLTRQAVGLYQVAKGIIPDISHQFAGELGPKTRAALVLEPDCK